MPWRIPRFTTLQLLLAAALCALLLGLATASWRATEFVQVTALEFSPTGDYLAAEFSTGSIQVWDIRGFKPRLASQIAATNAWTAFNELHFVDDQTILHFSGPTGEEAGFVRRIDLLNGKSRQIFAFPSYDRTPLAASANTVVLYDRGSHELECIRVGDRMVISRLSSQPSTFDESITPDGRTLVASDRGLVLSVFDVESGAVIYAEPIIGTTSAALSPNGHLLASVDTGTANLLPRAKVVDITKSIPVPIQAHHVPSPIWLEFSRDGQKLAIANKSVAIVFDVETGKPVGRVSFPPSTPHRSLAELESTSWISRYNRDRFALSPDASRIATFNGDNLQLWDTDRGGLVLTITDFSRPLQVLLLALLFTGWSAAWGVVSRREQRIAQNPTIKKPFETDTEFFSQTNPATIRVPIEIKLTWGLMVIGGLAAIALPITLFMHSGPVQWPMMYVSLATGMAAMAKGAGRQTTGLLWVTRAQLFNLLACDPINFVLGTLGSALLHRPHVQQYLALTNDLARPLR